MRARVTRSGEFELIERYFAPLSGAGGFGLKDDAALVEIGKSGWLVITQDAIAERVHFLPGDPPATIAKKALRINLSDLAAKGAAPFSFSMALGLPADWTEDWLAEFAKGLGEDCRRYRVELSGGDTFRVEAGPVIAITALGRIEPDRYATRMGAKPGDCLFVTGEIGAAAFGLQVRLGMLRIEDSSFAAMLEERYLTPEPPVEFAPLIGKFATAAIDISDGFVGDLRKLAVASSVGFQISADCIPYVGGLGASAPDAFPDRSSAVQTALTGGDDYQILFTVPEECVAEVIEASREIGVRVTRLGVADGSSGKVAILAPDGAEIAFDRAAWLHF
jgi:thiamine-monophosphate kinase